MEGDVVIALLQEEDDSNQQTPLHSVARVG